MDIFGSAFRYAGDRLNELNEATGGFFGGKSDESPALETAPVPTGTSDIARPQGLEPNVEIVHDAFSSSDMSNRSGGSIKPMSSEGASSMAGNYVVETGDPTLRNTDVVEKDAKKGRGIAQYTAARRGPYDQAREEHLAVGGDPNDIQFQLDYAGSEYDGKRDPTPGASLSGYTRSLSGETDGMNVRQATTHLRKDFFRPSEPHNERRVQAAERIYKQIKQRDARINDLASQYKPKNDITGTKIGATRADGKRWAGDDYGWQSNPSFKKLIGY